MLTLGEHPFPRASRWETQIVSEEKIQQLTQIPSSTWNETNEAVVVEPTTLRGIQGLKIDEFHLWSQSGGGYRKRHGRHRLRNTGNLDCFLSIPPSNILIAVQNGNKGKCILHHWDSEILNLFHRALLAVNVKNPTPFVSKRHWNLLSHNDLKSWHKRMNRLQAHFSSVCLRPFVGLFDHLWRTNSPWRMWVALSGMPW